MSQSTALITPADAEASRPFVGLRSAAHGKAGKAMPDNRKASTAITVLVEPSSTTTPLPPAIYQLIKKDYDQRSEFDGKLKSLETLMKQIEPANLQCIVSESDKLFSNPPGHTPEEKFSTGREALNVIIKADKNPSLAAARNPHLQFVHSIAAGRGANKIGGLLPAEKQPRAFFDQLLAFASNSPGNFERFAYLSSATSRTWNASHVSDIGEKVSHIADTGQRHQVMQVSLETCPPALKKEMLCAYAKQFPDFRDQFLKETGPVLGRSGFKQSLGLMQTLANHCKNNPDLKKSVSDVMQENIFLEDLLTETKKSADPSFRPLPNFSKMCLQSFASHQPEPLKNIHDFLTTKENTYVRDGNRLMKGIT